MIDYKIFSKFLPIAAFIVVMIVFAKNAYQNHRLHRAMQTDEDWHKIRNRIKKWVADNPDKTILDPEAQKLLRKEAKIWKKFCKYHSLREENEQTHKGLQSMMIDY